MSNTRVNMPIDEKSMTPQICCHFFTCLNWHSIIIFPVPLNITSTLAHKPKNKVFFVKSLWEGIKKAFQNVIFCSFKLSYCFFCSWKMNKYGGQCHFRVSLFAWPFLALASRSLSKLSYTRRKISLD